MEVNAVKEHKLTQFPFHSILHTVFYGINRNILSEKDPLLRELISCSIISCASAKECEYEIFPNVQIMLCFFFICFSTLCLFKNIAMCKYSHRQLETLCQYCAFHVVCLLQLYLSGFKKN